MKAERGAGFDDGRLRAGVPGTSNLSCYVTRKVKQVCPVTRGILWTTRTRRFEAGCSRNNFEKEERVVAGQLVGGISARQFSETHGFKIAFTKRRRRTSGKLISEAVAQGNRFKDLCAERFKDYQFGLKLIAQNTGRGEFSIDVEAVDAPDKVLSDWVVASYRKKEEGGS